MILRAIFLIALSVIGLPVFSQQAISVSNAWVREAPPGATMMAAYMTITNSGDKVRILEWVESMNFSQVMLHQSLVIDGIAKMVHQDALRIPAHGSVELKPGSYHLMLSSPKNSMHADDDAYFILHFRNGNCLMIETSVKRASDMQ